MAFHRFRLIFVAAAVALLAASSVGCQIPRDAIDVLYVGNSYIYFNNLPGMIERISTALEGPIVRGAEHTHGGLTLRGHLDDGHLPSILAQGPAEGGDWDWVVLHEQSTLGTTYDRDSGSLGNSDAFHGATREFAGMIRAEGAKPALYMTWAKEAFPKQTNKLSQAYRSIGTELGLEVAMVGEAWAEARRLRPEFSLYISDGSHPNAAGSYLAACVIYAVLTGRSPVGAPRELTGAPWDLAGLVESSALTILVSLSAKDAAFLQKIAWDIASNQLDDAGS